MLLQWFQGRQLLSDAKVSVLHYGEATQQHNRPQVRLETKLAHKVVERKAHPSFLCLKALMMLAAQEEASGDTSVSQHSTPASLTKVNDAHACFGHEPAMCL